MVSRDSVAREEVIKTCCAMCSWTCGIKAHVKEGKIVKVEGDPDHPVSQGYLCAKGAAATDYVYSPDRLKYPMKREGESWKRISWEEALDTISLELTKIKDTYGARSLAVITGMSFVTQGVAGMYLLRRFCDVYGTPNYFTPECMCFLSHIVANIMTLGKFPCADPVNSKCIVLWGHNPSHSNPLLANHVSKAMKKGAKLIVIDPRRIPLAKKARVHAQIRPGSDCALALGMLNVIISENLFDKEFVEKWTSGFDRLADHVKSYPPEEVEKITWVPAETIKQIARTYATAKPACIVQGFNALDQQAAGFQASRAIIILQSITGNLDIPGGYVSVNMGGLMMSAVPEYPSLRLPEMLQEKPLGCNEYPLCAPVFDDWTGQGMLLADTILTEKPYPIKMIIVAGSNPVVTWPNSNKFKQALGKLDFLVAMTQTMNETAQLANIVLPAATFLERTELQDQIVNTCLAAPYLNIRNKVIEFYEAWPDWKFCFESAKKMGYGEYFPWKDMEELIDWELKPHTGLAFKDLKGKNFVPYGSVEYKEYEKKGFKLPTGETKVPLYAPVMEMFGYDPLPTHKEPKESPISSPELAREYPLVLTTGARRFEYLHSSYRNIPKLRKKFPEPFAEIHPDTAQSYGIKNGEMVAVETKRGGIEIKAQFTEDILPGVISIPHGWAKANVNVLTDDKGEDPVTGYASLKALLCKIRKV